MKHSLWQWQREAERSLARSQARRQTEPDGANRFVGWALLALLLVAVVLVLVLVHL